MYSAPPVRVPVAAPPRRSGLAGAAPLLGVCCLGLLLLLIAATVVLALIPIYLTKKNVNAASGTTPSYTMTVEYNCTSGCLPDGSLPTSSFEPLARALETQLKLPTGSIRIVRGLGLGGGTGKRKRNTFALTRKRRQASVSNLFIEFVFVLERCGYCGGFYFRRLVRLTIEFYLTWWDGRSYFLVCVISVVNFVLGIFGSYQGPTEITSSTTTAITSTTTTLITLGATPSIS